jgi:hypothetical protein
MSYSYIKSVFPNFQPSKIENIYNVYSNSKPSIPKPEPAKNQIKAYNEQELTQFVKNLIQKSETVIPNKAKIDNTNNMIIQGEYISKYANEVVEPEKSIETFSEVYIDCNRHVNHILDCQQCKSIIMKQLNLESSKRKNEEMMEVLTYILFGIFILLVLENLK